MLPLLIQASIPSTSHPTVASSNRIVQNWASIQLNLIMLPVGIGILLIVSLTACICQCLRKKRIERIQKERRKQQRNMSKTRNGTHNKHELFDINSQTRITSPGPPHSGTEGSRPMSPFVSQPPRFKKEKRKKKDRKKKGRNSVAITEEDSSNVEKLNGTEFSTRIPVPTHSKQKKTPRYSIEEDTDPNQRHFDKKDKKSNSKKISDINGNLNHAGVEMNGNVVSSKERKKWDIPKNPKYERNSSMRLPPLASLRLAKTA